MAHKEFTEINILKHKENGGIIYDVKAILKRIDRWKTIIE